MKTIYVGNLPFSASEDDIRNVFAEYGEVLTVKLITDRETGRPRGFGFVEMDEEPGKKAIAGLQDYSLDGRTLQINEARERKPGRPNDRPRRY
ncbi:MAG TPA: RNA-binding protein [Candidatus Marinimicrobia bacterium]|nr:MAG: RNA-binding protein [Candidatus Marinimicrobia bacterium CG1_02_48_14]PJA54939.1 MAG: RNA-binding protein [Candidatus Marinimicrobia bacterium CG_4_9_14_3_um_filter_48_9]HCW76790.1 RNA-binding protein [Candidatus Neomarinimicrobiota bacterium]